MEIFKTIPGFENYEVSNLGAVRSQRGVRKVNTTKAGYVNISIYKEGKQRLIGVHQLVAMAFLNHKPDGHKLVVNHKDSNKSNNDVDNLEVITQWANVLHGESSSETPGIQYDKSKKKCWRVMFKKKHYGYFATKQEAIEYRNKL